jgi:hypothetical protein
MNRVGKRYPPVTIPSKVLITLFGASIDCLLCERVMVQLFTIIRECITSAQQVNFFLNELYQQEIKSVLFYTTSLYFVLFLFVFLSNIVYNAKKI